MAKKIKKIGRRRIIQLISAVIYNSNFKGFAEGKIYKGALKGVCVPGLNCYSCPGAVAACPLGSLQSALSELKFKLPLYIAGTLVIFGILFGRAVCSFLCPFGLIQELLYKIPSPKLKKSIWTRRLSFLKYFILLAFGAILPIYSLVKTGAAVPAFCKYICPAGTLQGGIPLVAADKSLQNIVGALFNWKILVLMITVVSAVFVYRFFCRFICPLGAIYSFFNSRSLIKINVDESKCSQCGACVQFCKMDTGKINDRECIKCGECRQVCENNAMTK
ncbi:MAG: 4Fe-4S binding protein [Oscillospiraceae bacterium]|nr:4Fe-4S binding protein [Oscillospiraceae bacterium]